jgi:GABA(A) receptor-associated protein
MGNSVQFQFKINNSLEKRKEEGSKIREKYTERIPIICEKYPNSNLKDINKTKFLVPSDLNVSQFSFIIRKHLVMEKTQAMYLICNGKPISGDLTLASVYESNREKEDGFLYIMYAGEIFHG